LRFSVGGVLDGGDQEHGGLEQLGRTMQKTAGIVNKNGDASFIAIIRVSLVIFLILKINGLRKNVFGERHRAGNELRVS